MKSPWLQMIKKMGNMGSLLSLIPGIGKYKKELDKVDMDGKEFKRIEAIITSMTAQNGRVPTLKC